MADKPEIMTVKEVAALWRFEPETVRRWVKMRRLKCMRIGNEIRFRRVDVIAAMEKYQYGDPDPRQYIIRSKKQKPSHDPSMG